MFGFVNIYKPKGITSHDVISKLRHVTKIRQIGHAGTLDPFAEGVLPVAIGKATRLIEYLPSGKLYFGTVKLGQATTTYDLEGEITNTSDKHISFEDVENILKNFRGEIEQIPPLYSAIKVNGKKLYNYARQGEAVAITPRKVYINKIEILAFDEINNTVELLIDCSKGTYIRSIANDIGLKLETYGHLTKLVRAKSGNFVLKDAIKIENIKSAEDIEKILLNPLSCFDYPKFELQNFEKEIISHGNNIKANVADGKILLVFDNNIFAVAEASGGFIKPKKVFI